MKSKVTFEVDNKDLSSVLMTICESSPDKLSVEPVNGGTRKKYKKRKKTLQKNKKV